MNAEARLRELGIELPPPPPRLGRYRTAKLHGDLLYVAGHGPLGADGLITGKVGADLDVEQAQEAARVTGLAILATMRQTLGTLDRVASIVKVLGMVNCAPGFDRIPDVVNGCSELLVDVFGEEGEHARSAVGMAELPFGIAVEIELIAAVAG